MQFISTRNSLIKKTLTQAMQCGLAEDGGLFVPEEMPRIDGNQFAQILSYPEFAAACLQPFFQGDLLQSSLSQICHDVFTFPVPLQAICTTANASMNARATATATATANTSANSTSSVSADTYANVAGNANTSVNTYLLELFHGPTASFKDFGARFLAACLSGMKNHQQRTIMVATSGDTGSAVASAFHRNPNINVIVLYPEGKISAKQEQQITCFDQNVLALAINGTFDDCQRMVKSAFSDAWWQDVMHISSANSINIGRLLPQMTYYAYTSTQFFAQHKKAAGFIIPTGNLGNATAAYWAQAMGFPICEIVLATNANTVIADYLTSGEFTPRPSVQTLANAMDVGHPSNFERLSHLFPTFSEFKQHVNAYAISDAEIARVIQSYDKEFSQIICPHTATAAATREHCSAEPWIIVATADPAKFDDVIEPLIHKKIPISPQLQSLLALPSHHISTTPDLNAIKEIAMQYFGTEV